MKYLSHWKSFRNSLRGNILHTVVNVSGFAISLAFVIYLGLYVQDEYTVDSFHAAKDRIYRLEHRNGTRFAFPVADRIKDRFPEVQTVVRTLSREVILRDAEGHDCLGRALVTDSAFFSVFSFPFVEGGPSHAMRTQNEAVLSESFARKCFGTEPALGRTINLYGKRYVVSGVVRDFAHTHFLRTDVFLPYSFIVSEWGERIVSKETEAWNLYLLAGVGTDPAARLSEVEHWLRSETGSVGETRNRSIEGLTFRPLQKVYFAPSADDPTGQRANNAAFLVILTVVALSILVFAVINYINLSVAQLGSRAQEMALRRLLGESRSGVFTARIVESIALCALAVVVSLFLVALLQPGLQKVLNTEVSLAVGLTWSNLAILIGGVVLLGGISGAIPAAMIARFRPIEIVRGTFRRRTKMVYSRVLIAFQYGITIVLIGCTITILAQLRFMRTSDPGFDKERLILCSSLLDAREQNGFRDRLMAIPGVERVSFVRGYPMAEELETLEIETPDGETIVLDSYVGDTAFVPILGLEILHRTGVEHDQACWLNETAWRRLGLEDEATEYRTGQGKTLRIRGKIRDFHSRDFTHGIEGCLIRPLGEHEAWEILIKVSVGDPFGTMERIRASYNEYVGGNLFDGRFMDRYIDDLYRKQASISQMISILAVVAIVISSLGMLAMATYFTRQRMQEVAVRKTFGAQNTEVLRQLMFGFLKLVLVAFVAAVPVILYLMREWLSDYAYRIPLSWWIFAASGLLAGVMAGAMVFGQALKISRVSPVLVLKKQ